MRKDKIKNFNNFLINKYLLGLSTMVTVDPDATASWLKLGFFENLKERKSPRALGLGLSLSVEEFIYKTFEN